MSVLIVQAAASNQPASGCLTALVTWAPVIGLLFVFFLVVRRMGYFSKSGGYMKRTEEHMQRVEDTLSKIEEHLRKLSERDRVE